MLLMKKIGLGIDVLKHYCPVMPNSIRIYFPQPPKWLPGCKTHSDNASKKSNNSGRARAELDVLSSAFIGLIKSCSPVSSRIPGVSVPTWPPALVIRWTEGTDCTVSYNNWLLLNEFVAKMCPDDAIISVGLRQFALAEKNISFPGQEDRFMICVTWLWVKQNLPCNSIM